MFVAQKKRKENISEYILYMFQIEDIIRALGGDDKAIEDYVSQNYNKEGEPVQDVIEWYLRLRDEMLRSNTISSGHVPMIQSLLIELNVIHQQLLKMPVQSIYSTLYYKTLPSIIQLRTLSNDTQQNEIETCFVGVYGYLTLKMKGKDVSEETLSAIKQISTFLALLADRYCEIEAGNIKLNEA
ncbi:DUF4924 family protein [Porphyromonas sp.]|uniref:DUF4924 family protein n=1 Tax=Porphyromonas sp. TaxID=1924944 RepID=UPI0026DB4B43|nr:DUF4924 family protein [Porphyromonas sp.]MDO4770260.1 DUF4924 family protein [Porphyromonas sp.]